MRRHIAIVAVVVLVSMAGCSGVLIGGDDASTNDGPSNDAGSANEAPTLETVAYPDGYDANGVANASRALSTHDAAIADAEGYRLSASIRVGTGDQAQEFVLNSTVDNAAGTEYSKLQLAGSSEVYRAPDGSTYTRIYDGSNEKFVASQPEGTNGVSMSEFRTTVSDVDLAATSVSREGSTTLITYTGDELKESVDTVQGSDNASVELVVDTEGRIHSLSIAYGEDASADFEFEYGSVTVEEPDWLDEAKAATSS